MHINVMILDYYAEGKSWSYMELGRCEFDALPQVGHFITLERAQWIRTFKVIAVALHSPPSDERGYNSTVYLEYIGTEVGGDHSFMNKQATEYGDVETMMALGEHDWEELRKTNTAA